MPIRLNIQINDNLAQKTGVVNILFTTSTPVFYRTVDSKTERHTSEYMASIFSQAKEYVLTILRKWSDPRQF